MATPPILFFLLSSASDPTATATATATLTISPNPVSLALNITTNIVNNGNKRINNNGNYPRIAREFLNSHNTVRSIVGDWGARIRVGQEADPTLEVVVRAAKGGLPADKMFWGYGENMFWGSGLQWKAEDAVKYWANEHLYYDYDSNSCEPDKMCGHFTQMAWNRTVRVRCGRQNPI